MEILTSRSLVQWSDIVPSKWLHESRSLHERGLVANYSFQPSSEVDNAGGARDHALVLVVSGRGRQIQRYDGREFDGAITAGDFALLPAQMPSFHAWECDLADECVTLYIEPTKLARFAAENGWLQADRLELLPILNDRDPHLEAIATSFRAELQTTERMGGKLYTESLTNLLFIHLLRNYCTQTFSLPTEVSGLSTYQRQQVLEFIHAHFTTDLKLQDLSELLGMSQYYFCRSFKQSLGVSPYRYILQQRVELAKQLLSHQPQQAIAAIAQDCGFSSQSQLTQHFRKLTGTTPRAYRRG